MIYYIEKLVYNAGLELDKKNAQLHERKPYFNPICYKTCKENFISY